MVSTPGPVTQLLVAWTNGNRAALEELIPAVYPELRRIAGRYLRRERVGHTLQPTALVHEAYVRRYFGGRAWLPANLEEAGPP
jgi:DNA-directed RNA polymerase specialized sigma24 family protein